MMPANQNLEFQGAILSLDFEDWLIAARNLLLAGGL